jgi:hypothetical protein
MVTYYSKAWVEACRDNLNASEEHLKKGRKLSGKFAFRVWDGPDGKDRLSVWEFVNGRCSQVRFEARPAPWKELREAPYDDSWIGRFSCPFDLIAKLNRGEISPLRALSSPKYSVEGKKVLLFKMMQGINSWNDHNARIACRYDFSKSDEDGNAF